MSDDIDKRVADMKRDPVWYERVATLNAENTRLRQRIAALEAVLRKMIDEATHFSIMDRAVREARALLHDSQEEKKDAGAS